MKILLPVDGSATSDAAVAFVAARPPIDGGHPQIDLLNVQLPIPPRAGRAVGAEIARAAEAERLDILVMGSHGRGAFTSALLGSVAWRVAATCATPLQVIRGAGDPHRALS